MTLTSLTGTFAESILKFDADGSFDNVLRVRCDSGGDSGISNFYSSRLWVALKRKTERMSAFTSLKVEWFSAVRYRLRNMLLTTVLPHMIVNCQG